MATRSAREYEPSTAMTHSTAAAIGTDTERQAEQLAGRADSGELAEGEGAVGHDEQGERRRRRPERKLLPEQRAQPLTGVGPQAASTSPG